MSNNAAFAVPKDMQDVSVHLLSGQLLEGAIFLEYSANALTVLQKVNEFLEDGNVFFPLRLKESGATEFINKGNVRIVELANPAEDEQNNSALSLMLSVHVTVLFVNEQTLGGMLLADVPVEKARLSDCLNLPSRFLIVKVDRKVCYLNKSALQKVIYAGKA